MNIITKRGDGGFTDLLSTEKPGRRVQKDDPLIECLGTLDELEAFCVIAGITAKSCGDSQNGNIIAEIREELVNAVMPAVASLFSATTPPAFNITRLELLITDLEKENSIHGFMRTWTKPAAAYLNIARSICRRAERRMTTVIAKSAAGFENTSDTTAAALLAWLNRLSDLLFLLAVSEERQGC